MSSIINYNTAPSTILTAVPFTWGSKSVWAIKSPSGDIFYLHDGSAVHPDLPSESVILRQPNFTYATTLEIK